MANADFAQKVQKAVRCPIVVCAALAFEKPEIKRTARNEKHYHLFLSRQKLRRTNGIGVLVRDVLGRRTETLNKGIMTMTTTNQCIETANVRALTEAEIADVSGGAISFGAWISRMIWQLQNAEEGIECDEDWGVCATPSK